MKLILQSQNSAEIRSIVQCAAVSNDLNITRQDINGLSQAKDELANGAMAVGSVEFVRHAFDVMGVALPVFDPYDSCLPERFWGRKIWKTEVMNAICAPPIFIKPIQVKQFNGFVYRGNGFEYDAHDRDQLAILDSQFSLFDKIYASPVVDFVAEWRCYITQGDLIAICRYDAHEDEHDPDLSFVDEVLAYFPDRTLAADIGKTRQGRFMVVELNDAWAVGKYQGIGNNDYFDFLRIRWCEITQIGANRNNNPPKMA